MSEPGTAATEPVPGAGIWLAIDEGSAEITLGRPAESDIDLLGELQMPIKALNETL